MVLPGLQQAAMGRPFSSRGLLDWVVGLPRAEAAMGHPLVSSALLQAVRLGMWCCLCIRGCPAWGGHGALSGEQE